MKISYAQNAEDMLLARVFAGQKTGFYVDVGAWHPVEDSVTNYFYKLGWSGINIEADEKYARLLKKERTKDVNLHLLVGKSDSDAATYYWIEDTGISTMRVDYAIRHRNAGFKVEEKKLPVQSLAHVFAENVGSKTVDFLKIDVEGAEEDVIDGMDWKAYRPRVLIIEATEPNSQKPAWDAWEPKLLSSGYTFAYFDGLNRYYVRNEEASSLLNFFATPLNVFDNFVPNKFADAVKLQSVYGDFTKSAIFRIAYFVFMAKSVGIKRLFHALFRRMLS